MLVRSSHLALRFYRNDGWTLEFVKKYVDGHIIARDFDVYKFDIGYFIPDIGAKINAEKLIEDGHVAQDYRNDILGKKQSLEYFREMEA